jgi:hypothetical protein
VLNQSESALADFLEGVNYWRRPPRAAPALATNPIGLTLLIDKAHARNMLAYGRHHAAAEILISPPPRSRASNGQCLIRTNNLAVLSIDFDAGAHPVTLTNLLALYNSGMDCTSIQRLSGDGQRDQPGATLQIFQPVIRTLSLLVIGALGWNFAAAQTAAPPRGDH